ncbi:MAG: hypothetical protein AAGI68_01125 [Planctomycetota bacterium]
MKKRKLLMRRWLAPAGMAMLTGSALLGGSACTLERQAEAIGGADTTPSDPQVKTVVGVATYLGWLETGDPARGRFLQKQIESFSGDLRNRIEEPSPSLDIPPQPTDTIGFHRIGVVGPEKARDQFVVITWHEPRHDADRKPVEPVLGLEVFLETQSGLSLIARGCFDVLPCEINPHLGELEEVMSMLRFEVIDDHWIFLVVPGHEGGFGTGLFASYSTWHEISREGMAYVWAEHRKATDANTGVDVESGMYGYSLAVLNGRPAIFADQWKMLEPVSDIARRSGETMYYRGMAVYTQSEGLGAFEIDPQYSSMSARQAAPAYHTPRTDRSFIDLFADKMPPE